MFMLVRGERLWGSPRPPRPEHPGKSLGAVAAVHPEEARGVPRGAIGGDLPYTAASQALVSM